MDGRSKSANTYSTAIEKDKNHVAELAEIEKRYLAKVEEALSKEKFKKKFKDVKFTLLNGQEFTITHEHAYSAGQRLIADLKAELAQALTIGGFDQRYFIVIDTLVYLSELSKILENDLSNIKQQQDAMLALVTIVKDGIKQANDLVVGDNISVAKKDIVKLLEDESKKLDKARQEQSKKKLDQFPPLNHAVEILLSGKTALDELEAFYDSHITPDKSIPEVKKVHLLLLLPRVAILLNACCAAFKNHKTQITQLKATQSTLDSEITQLQPEVKSTLTTLKNFDPTKKEKSTKKPALAVVSQTATQATLLAAMKAAEPATQATGSADNFVKFAKIAVYVQNELALLNQAIEAGHKDYVEAVKSGAGTSKAGVSSEAQDKGMLLVANIAKFFELVKLQKAHKLDVIPTSDSSLLSAENFNTQIEHFKAEFTKAMQSRDTKLVEKLHAALKEIFRTSENSRTIDPSFKATDSPKLALFAQNQEKMKTDLPKMVERMNKVRSSLMMLKASLKEAIDQQVEPFREIVGFVNSAATTNSPAKPSSPTSARPTRSPQRSPLATQVIAGTTFKRPGVPLSSATKPPIPDIGSKPARFGKAGNQ